MKTTEMINSLHNQILKERAILRLIETDKFKSAYENSDEHNQEKVQYYIQTLRLEDLKLWLKTKLKIEFDIENLTIEQLRELARDLGVKKYYLFSKENLIYRIREELWSNQF